MIYLGTLNDQNFVRHFDRQILITYAIKRSKHCQVHTIRFQYKLKKKNPNAEARTNFFFKSIDQLTIVTFV